MNVSLRQLELGREIVVFAVNGTSGREGTVERMNGIVAGVLSNWFLDNPVTDVTFKVSGLVCAVLWAAGFISGWPRKQGETKPIWERRMRGQYFSSVVYGVARYKTQPRRVQHQRQQTEAQNHRLCAMHPRYWKGGGYTNATWCKVTGRPSLQGVPVHHTSFPSLVHATRSARWKTIQAVINAVCALITTPATNFFWSGESKASKDSSVNSNKQTAYRRW
ncbi:hypothetical protein CSKR_104627 [Clonorchis sinensis]|uniref:Uncharacterized protein n=1 Tax=Clonorchis sinensis TaxID=79923 RepID=A0A419PLQ3_CLOSI|nr:hypothetical protein CSKR_104627 [Clonorchis sinensis]